MTLNEILQVQTAARNGTLPLFLFKDRFIALKCTNVYMNVSVKLFQIPHYSLHEISDLIQAIDVLDVEKTFMLTATKS
jgi:hypothetical protein